MFSQAVDAAWHRMLGTPEYAAFSTEHADTVLGHRTMSGTGPIGWVVSYEKTYGLLPEIWSTGRAESCGTKTSSFWGRSPASGTATC
ncbi:hypothetical protein CP967_12090 [Streptomyces nitrosporeus]|uniref:Uncharacterized protein n=2 Tax=Streptomyces nitrosporeus TaxID=28894 RepID=A0A5J6F9E3_9ACTN|nr:hypothetical protein CP967_12090 [Streptomyces nitrosporeus]